MDFELLRGSGRRVLKTRKFQSGGGHHKPSGTEIPRGCGGVKIKKTSVGGGGYGYFLELHNLSRTMKTWKLKLFLMFKRKYDIELRNCEKTYF